MPTWGELLARLQERRSAGDPSPFDTVRRGALADLASYTGRNAVLYAAGYHADVSAFPKRLQESELERAVWHEGRGEPFERPLWQVILQVANHGVHHRAEMAMAFAALGKPTRQLDYILFELERSIR